MKPKGISETKNYTTVALMCSTYSCAGTVVRTTITSQKQFKNYIYIAVCCYTTLL